MRVSIPSLLDLTDSKLLRLLEEFEYSGRSIKQMVRNALPILDLLHDRTPSYLSNNWRNHTGDQSVGLRNQILRSSCMVIQGYTIPPRGISAKIHHTFPTTSAENSGHTIQTHEALR